MAVPGWYRWSGDDLVLRLHIQTRSNRNELGEFHNDRLKIRLTAPPVDGKANQMLITFLARQFGVAKNSVRIDSGESNRLKTVVVHSPAKLPPGLELGPKTAKNC